MSSLFAWDMLSNFTGNMKRRVGKTLMNKYLGEFLEGAVLASQLTTGGDVSVSDVSLNAERINRTLEEAELPFELLDGFVRHLSVSVPWSNLLADDCRFAADGLTVTLQVRMREQQQGSANLGASIFHSMCESFSSMSVAEDCLKTRMSDEEEEDEDRLHKELEEAAKKRGGEDGARGYPEGLAGGAKVIGIEMVAQAIDSIMSRVKMTLKNTTVRLEFVPDRKAGRGLALEVKVDTIMFSGDDDSNPEAQQQQQQQAPQHRKQPRRYARKLFLEGVTLHSDDFTYKIPPGADDSMLESLMRRSRLPSGGDSSVRSDEGDEEEDDDDGDAKSTSPEEEDDTQPLLQWAALTGKQELVVRFSDTNQFGLPRSLDEVELNMGGLVVHLFPHQIHTLTEIIDSLSVNAPSSTPPAGGRGPSSPPFPTSGNQRALQYNPSLDRRRLEEQRALSLENALVKQSLMLQHGGEGGWTSGAATSSMSDSSDFHSMVGGHISMTASEFGQTVPFPRITVSFSCVLCVLHERDDCVTRLGGEATRQLAARTMNAKAYNFFSKEISHPDSSVRDQASFYFKQLSVRHSHLALVAAPVKLVYEEGDPATAFLAAAGPGGGGVRPKLGKDTRLKLSLTLGQTLLKEVLYHRNGADDSRGKPAHVGDLLTFTGSRRVGDSDLQVVYSEESLGDGAKKASVDINLKSCRFNFDPGFVDRTYLLLNYSELCPPDTPRRSRHQKAHADLASATSDSQLSVNFRCPDLDLGLWVPRADVRDASDVPSFVETFWSRRVHPEEFRFRLQGLDFRIGIPEDVTRCPLEVRVKASRIEGSFRPSPDAPAFTIIQIEKSQEKSKSGSSTAAYVVIKVNLDDENLLTGKFCSVTRRKAKRAAAASRSKSGKAATSSADDGLACCADGGSFYVSAGGRVTGRDESQNSVFAKQLGHVREALDFGKRHNNILVDLRFDRVSLAVPSKHTYEVVYNRLGNDLILWKPDYFKVKEHLFKQHLPDPLADPNMGFSTCFSLNAAAESVADRDDGGDDHKEMFFSQIGDLKQPKRDKVSPPKNPGFAGAFPRDRSSELLIHIDTSVSLYVNSVVAVITSSDYNVRRSPAKDDDQEEEDLVLDDRVLLLRGSDLRLTCAVGLDRDPYEMSVFELDLGSAAVNFGRHLGDLDDLTSLAASATLPSSLAPLLARTDLGGRAWGRNKPQASAMVLTAKILFDPATNLKAINLAFTFGDTGIRLQSLVREPEWVDWLAKFFTVVEYPVDGYTPPAIMTHMQFELCHCSVDVVPACHATRLSLCIGRAKVACNIQDEAPVPVDPNAPNADSQTAAPTKPPDMQFDVHLEDLSLFLGWQSSPAESVCLADLDFIDVTVNSAPKSGEEDAGRTDVSVGGNMLRIRTCPDGLVLLGELVTSMLEERDRLDPSLGRDRDARESSAEPVREIVAEEENVVPDLADAMEELVTEEERQRKEAKRARRLKQQEEQVFLFSEEKRRPRMEQSIMEQSVYGALPDGPTDEALDEFEVIQEGAVIKSKMQKSRMPRRVRRDRTDTLDQHGKRVSSQPLPSADVNEDDPGLRLTSRADRQRQRRLDEGNSRGKFKDAADRGFTFRLRISPISIGVRLYGGCDFGPAVKCVYSADGRMVRAIVGTDITAKRATKRHSQTTTSEDLKMLGGLARDDRNYVEAVLNKISFLHQEGIDGKTVQTFSIRSYEVRDRVAESSMNKLLHVYTTRISKRQKQREMLEVSVTSRKSIFDPNVTDMSIYVSMQSLRLNIDQDTLFFLINFFKALSPGDDDAGPVAETMLDRKRIGYHGGDTRRSGGSVVPPVSTETRTVRFSTGQETLEILPDEEVEDRDALDPAEEVFEDAVASAEASTGGSTPRSPSPNVTRQNYAYSAGAGASSSLPNSSSKQRNSQFICSFNFSPEVHIRLDYASKCIDLRQGLLAGLLTGLADLNCSELTLHELRLESVPGMHRLLAMIVKIWTDDIRQNQIPRLLVGVGPMHSIYKLVQGLCDLILLPLEQYQKDGRLVRGLQRGASSFTQSTALACLEITHKMLGAVRFFAEVAFDIMSPEAAVVQGKLPHQYQMNRRQIGGGVTQRPADIREGVVTAYEVMKQGLEETSRSLQEAVVREQHRGRGISGMVGGVLREVPSAIVRPMIYAAEAGSNVVEGVQGTVAPEIRREERDKWKDPSHLDDR